MSQPTQGNPIRLGARGLLALWACRITRALLRLFRRGGTALPGKVALKICPALLGALSGDVETIVVTGTNGKTTTSALLAAAFEAQGGPVLHNRAGANLLSGITAEFAACAHWLGRPKYRRAVIECDEAALKHVTPLLRPQALVVTNLFRDQLDRYGEVMHTLAAVRDGAREAHSAVLCLNADCSLTASLAADLPNDALYFGFDVGLPDAEAPVLSDAPRCLRCGAAYGYEYRTYSHLGGFFCPACGYRRPAADVAVTALGVLGAEASACELSVRSGPCATPGVEGDRRGDFAAPEDQRQKYTMTVALPGVYNLYNAAAAVTGALAMGLDPAAAVASLAEARSSFGRMESFRLDNTDIRMILVKNPAGCDRALSYLASLEGGFLPVFCLNDRTADGRDVSWIWDADFERFYAKKKPARILVSGDRAEDMRLRLKYAGAPEESTELCRDTGALLARLRESPVPAYVLPTYTAMLGLRHELSRACGGKDFYEA